VVIEFLTILNTLNLSKQQYPENIIQSAVYAGYTSTSFKYLVHKV